MFLLVLCMFKIKTTPRKCKSGIPPLPQYDLSSELQAFAQFAGFKFLVSWGTSPWKFKLFGDQFGLGEMSYHN